MAIAMNDTMVSGSRVCMATLLDAVGATGDGEWIDMSGLRDSSVHVVISVTATVLIRGSNEPTRPANNTHGFSMQTHTATGGGAIDVRCRWLKAYVSSYGSGTVSCYFYGEN